MVRPVLVNPQTSNLGRASAARLYGVVTPL